MTTAATQTEQQVIEQLKARIAELEAAKDSKRKTDVQFENGLSLRFNRLGTKITDSKGVTRDAKGNLSIYGFGRFPASFYLGQWRKLYDVVEEINEAVEAEAKRNTLAIKTEEE